MLKQFRIYYFLLSSLLMITSCIDDVPLPEPTNGEIVFKLSAVIDNEEKVWEAGLDNQYMYTYTSRDSNDLVQFQGTLGEVGCQFCPNSISFDFVQKLNDNTVNALFAQDIDFRNATIPLEIVGYNTSFEANLNGISPYTLEWDFGDGSTPIITNASNLQHEFVSEGLYHVCLKITDASGCESVICRDISTDNMMNCSINFDVFNLGNNFSNSFFFHTYPAGVPPFHYHWNVPLDTSIYQNFIVQSPTVTMNQLGAMSVRVDMTDDNNCNCSLTQTVNFHNLDTSCIHHFDYLTEPIYTPGSLEEYFSTLNIQYIDENGNLFSSALGEQPDSSFIHIIDIQDFILNEDNLPTKKIDLEFSCRLYDINGNYKELSNGTGTIGIAYE